MRNNYASVDESIARMQQLMGNTKPVVETKQQPLGSIEKVVKAKNGNTYAIVKENSNYYLKTSPKSADLTLNDFEYLGGSHKYKGLYEYKSYNHAEKVLKEELINISMEKQKTEEVITESARIDTNLKETVGSKEMRSEIDRIREIMENSVKINKEGSASVVVEQKEKLLTEKRNKVNEVSLDDENILTDSEEPEVVDLDGELGLEDEVGVDELPGEEVAPEEGLEAKIDDLAAKLDPAIEKLDQLLDQYGGDLGDDDEMIEIEDDFEEPEEIGFDEEMGEDAGCCDKCSDNEDPFFNETKKKILKKIYEAIDTIAGDVTKDKMGYEEVGPDSEGRTSFEDVSAEEDIDYESGFHQDTLGDVKSTANVSSLKGGGSSSSGFEIEIVEDESESDLKECGVIDNVSENKNKMLYVVEASGKVVGKIPANSLSKKK